MDDIFALAAEAYATKILIAKIKENFAAAKTLDNVIAYGHLLQKYVTAHSELIAAFQKSADLTAKEGMQEVQAFREAVRTAELPSDEKAIVEANLSFVLDPANDGLLVQ